MAVNTKSSPTIQYVGGPYYDDPHSNKVLFPFSFLNGELDINPINGFNLESGILPKNVGPSGVGGLVRLLGGVNLVQSIGQNFKKYIFNCTWGINSGWDISNINSIQVYKNSVITKVQQLDYLTNLPNYINPEDDSYVISSNPPSDFTFPDVANYGVTYIFDSPLVISVDTVGNGKQYITFFSSRDH